METQEHLIQALETAHQEMRTLVNEVGEHMELYPRWTMKHFLAHLTGWDEATTVSLSAHAKGNEPAAVADRGIDYYNAQSVAERETLDYRHIIMEWEQAHEKFKAAVLDLSGEKLTQEMVFPWGATGSAKALVEDMIHHERQHFNELKKLVIELTTPKVEQTTSTITRMEEKPQLVTSGKAVDELGLVHRVHIPEGNGPHPTLVMVHGLQGNEDVTWIFARAASPEWLIISPRAPFPAEEGYRWSDLSPDHNGTSESFEQGLEKLKQFVSKLPEIYPVDRSRIVILGFSQGASMGYALAATSPGLLSGLAALSSFIPTYVINNLSNLKGLPVLLLHGTKDETISIEVARKNRDQLHAANATLTYNESDVGHKISSTGMAELKQWLKARLVVKEQN